MSIQYTTTNSILRSLINAYGKETGSRLYAIIQEMCGGSISHQQEICNVLLENSKGNNGPFLESELRVFGATSLFRTMLYPEITYCNYIKPIFTYGLYYAKNVQAYIYPDFPIKMVYERKRINLSELDTELGSFLVEKQQAEGNYPLDTNPSAFFYLFAEEVFTRLSNRQHISKTLEFFISGLQLPAERGKYFYLLMKMFLFFIEERSLPLGQGTEKLKHLLKTKNIDPKEIVFMLYDFYLDNRYKTEHLLTIFSLMIACIQTFYPKRKYLIPKILNLLKDFIRISGTKTSQYTKTVFNLFVQNPYIDLTEWVEEGARIIREHGDTSQSAEAYFSRESDLSNRIWKKIDAGIHFDQVYQRLQFFANAITERPVSLKNNETVPLWQNYHLFYTDGTSVFVPQYVHYQQDREKNFTMMLHCVAHECAHIEFGSFLENKKRYRWARSTFDRLFPGEYEKNRTKLRAYLDKVKSMLDEMGYDVRILQPSPDSASYLTKLLFHAPFPHMFSGMWNIIEDYRIDTLLYRKYPGYRMEKEFVDRVDFTTVSELDSLNLADNIINGLIQYIRFGKLKGKIHSVSEDVFSNITDIVSRFKIAEKTDVYASFVVAGHIHSRLLAHIKREDPHFFQDLEVNNPNILLNEQDSLGTTNNRNSLLPIEIHIMKERLSPKGYEKIEQEAKEQKTRASMQQSLEAHAHPEVRRELDKARRLYSYPEWDHQKNCYINDRCILADIPWETGHVLHPDSLQDKYGNYISHLRQVFFQLRPQRYCFQRGMDDGFEIDFDKYVDSLMDFTTGNEMDNNFYIYRQRQERSVSVALVLDMSPSTDEKLQDATIFLYEKYATYLLCEALQASGDQFGIFSFFDFGPKASLFYTLKDFNETYSEEHYRRLTAFKPAEDGFSRLAVGLRHILNRMKTQETKTNIIFFITDGLPFYFEDTVNEGKISKEFQIDGKRTVLLDYPVPVVSVVAKSKKYIKEDMRKVYEEAALAGVHLFCITLDSESVDFMHSIFGNRLIYLPDITELPQRLLEIFRKVTK